MGRPASVPRSEVGQRIVEAREAAGLSQEQLADKLGVPLPNITFWERRAPAPRSEVLAKLASVLGVSIDYLLLGAEHAPPKKKPGPAGRARKVFDRLDGLPRNQQAKILDVVEAMLLQQAAG